jgi:hypothetical protein
VPTTVLGSEPTYSPIIITASLAMLAVLFSRRNRMAFGPSAVAAATQNDSPPPEEQRREARAISGSGEWRVGHQGRDQMFYEECHGGAWQRITIDGEMLTGRAHHVIYFASPENWLRYPDWARHRRDEIIARIKSHFREPDYEYAGGGSASAVAVSRNAGPMKSSELRAVVVTVALLLGISALMGWLVARGVSKGETYWPAKRASQQRSVVRATESAMFWTSIGVYSSIGIGTLGLAICIVRWSRK